MRSRRCFTAVSENVHRLALRMTGCCDDAADATQEILVKVLTRLSKIPASSSSGASGVPVNAAVPTASSSHG
jgi:DNA-directed RNA polymerase specialized sigma24 family protein